MTNQPKSGTRAPRKAPKKKGAHTVPAATHHELMKIARDLETRLWASNVLLAGLLAQSGGSVEVHKTHLQGLREPWSVSQKLDAETGVYRIMLHQAGDETREEPAS